MYLCNRLKLCRCSYSCGKDCILTKDKAYEYKPTSGQHIVCNNKHELEWFVSCIRETEIDFKVEGFKIMFL